MNNVEVFAKAVQPNLDLVCAGYNATYFAYGITGSGKTHTIFGKGGMRKTALTDTGISFLMMDYVFNKV